MIKIRCSSCSNEEESHCLVKKRVKVHANKPRKCKAFIFNPDKVKKVEEIPTIRMSYAQKRKLKELYKAELKQLKEDQRRGVFDKSKSMQHPTTGDLSRFTTTAVKDKGE
ncbi:MAG: hypothetical protein DRO11_04930 [Methanobacteriota archaeon]|nr:MAG: hypothetical protein DRO11_04930 [Euryarchaeota archaeon]